MFQQTANISKLRTFKYVYDFTRLELLQKLVGEVRGEEMSYPIAATGGEALKDIFSEVPELGWKRLVNEFLHSL